MGSGDRLYWAANPSAPVGHLPCVAGEAIARCSLPYAVGEVSRSDGGVVRNRTARPMKTTRHV